MDKKTRKQAGGSRESLSCDALKGGKGLKIHSPGGGGWWKLDAMFYDSKKNTIKWGLQTEQPCQNHPLGYVPKEAIVAAQMKDPEMVKFRGSFIIWRQISMPVPQLLLFGIVTSKFLQTWLLVQTRVVCAGCSFKPHLTHILMDFSYWTVAPEKNIRDKSGKD